MSFGGGSDGSTGITDHVHDNNVGEGGELENNVTLMSALPLSTRILLGF